jgi:hypothetical protein
MPRRYETTVLRNFGREAMAAAGMPIEPMMDGHAASQLYRIKANAGRNAGRLVLLRTNNQWAVMDYATGTASTDPIEHVERADFVCIVCVTPLGEIETYVVPADRLSADMKAGHQAFTDRIGRPSNGTVRILKFSNDPARSWHGYSEKYATFKIGQTPRPDVPPPQPRRSGRQIVEQAQRMIAEAFSVPVTAVRISVDFNVPQ